MPPKSSIIDKSYVELRSSIYNKEESDGDDTDESGSLNDAESFQQQQKRSKNTLSPNSANNASLNKSSVRQPDKRKGKGKPKVYEPQETSNNKMSKSSGKYELRGGNSEERLFRLKEQLNILGNQMKQISVEMADKVMKEVSSWKKQLREDHEKTLASMSFEPRNEIQNLNKEIDNKIDNLTKIHVTLYQRSKADDKELVKTSFNIWRDNMLKIKDKEHKEQSFTNMATNFYNTKLKRRAFQALKENAKNKWSARVRKSSIDQAYAMGKVSVEESKKKYKQLKDSSVAKIKAKKTEDKEHVESAALAELREQSKYLMEQMSILAHKRQCPCLKE